MSHCFHKGIELGPKDLNIIIENANTGARMSPYSITYTIFDQTAGIKSIFGTADQTPVQIEVGEFYAPFKIPDDANTGSWVAQWHVIENAGDPKVTFEEEFSIIGDLILVRSNFDPIVANMVTRLRIALRDNDPDRNYRFSPPSHEEEIQAFTNTYGYIWEDYELLSHLQNSVADINLNPPLQGFTAERLPPTLYGLAITGAMWYALISLSINWVHDEFGYSIGGISLDLERSGKYQSLAESMKTQFEDKLEKYKKTVKITYALLQPFFNIGVFSALGPVGSLHFRTARNYLSFGSGGFR